MPAQGSLLTRCARGLEHLFQQVVRFEMRSRLFRSGERKEVSLWRQENSCSSQFCFRLRFSEKAFSFWASFCLSFMLFVQVNWFLKRRRCLIGKDEKRSDRMLVVKETYLEIFLEMVFDDLLSA